MKFLWFILTMSMTIYLLLIFHLTSHHHLLITKGSVMVATWKCMPKTFQGYVIMLQMRVTSVGSVKSPNTKHNWRPFQRQVCKFNRPSKMLFKRICRVWKTFTAVKQYECITEIKFVFQGVLFDLIWFSVKMFLFYLEILFRDWC